jgi:hypothetical protein
MRFLIIVFSASFEIPDDIEDFFEILWGKYKDEILDAETAALQKQFTPDDPPIIKV